MLRALIFFIIILKTSLVFSQGYDVYSIGIYDVKFDGSSSNYATDLRYERRFDNTIIDIAVCSCRLYNGICFSMYYI